MLLGSNLGSGCWSDTMLHAAYLKKRLPHKSLQIQITPHEAWTNKKPDLSRLRVFGFVMHAKKPGIRTVKLDTSVMTKCMLLGHTPASYNAMCHDTVTRETKTSRNFVVDEARCKTKTDRPPCAKDLLLNQKDAPSKRPLSC